MKLDMQTPHEARMCPIDFEVKRSKVQVTMHKGIYNDKAYSYPQHVGKFFNFRIFIEFFIHEVNKTLTFWELGPYLYSK